ncbi:RloB family protein [Legionella bononiensis]|uniref:RloB domain-containing protein n=1 Tax=Legionella bononiensis TaxID=2793102 RepID=A0ABS1WDY2_9GAMM|nr:RloB family protein [Legionella bononiensis]MBL7479569.1 RloB domain-containing protein [Legionella bononiensis]MBL7527556.1 RloB domain-containing protein [Legionella bononiensis]
MSQKRRIFTRYGGIRPYRKLYIIVAEGSKTELQYFSSFQDKNSIIKLIFQKPKHSSPQYVLKQMEKCLKEEDCKITDEAWLVVDKDSWTDQQLSELFNWSKKSVNFGFALSNPNFEYWLILHFEDGNNIKSASDCMVRLNNYLPDYDKGVDINRIKNIGSIDDAIRRGKNRDNPPCTDWPKTLGSTTVYKLVESIQRAKST